MAERRGEEYEGNAQDPPPDVEMRRASEEPETYPAGGQGPLPA